MPLKVTNLVGFGGKRAAAGGGGGTPDSYSINTEGTDGGLASTTVAGSDVGTGDFTIEAWVYTTDINLTSIAAVFGHGAGSGGRLQMYVKDDGTVQINVAATIHTSSTGAISESGWQHIAGVRSSGTFKIYVDGSEASSASESGDITVDDLYVGAQSAGNLEFQGYIYRPHLNTAALYTSGFTPSNAYEADANTVYLVKANGTNFTDTEGNSITNNGATQQLAAPS